MYIEPVENTYVLASAAKKAAAKNYAALTDAELSAWCARDVDGAHLMAHYRDLQRDDAATARAAAFEKALRAAPSAPAAPAAQRARFHKGDDWESFAAREKRSAVPVFLLDTVLDCVRDALKDLRSEISVARAEKDALAARICALEARPTSPGIKWAGVHEPGREYAEGELATRSGSLWLATQRTSQTPGMDPHSWRLIVKQGHVAP
jgi:hypothetical protein